MRKKPKSNKKRSNFNPIKYVINEMDKIFESNRESETLSEEEFNTYKDQVKKDLVGVTTKYQKFETKERLTNKTRKNFQLNYALRDPKTMTLIAKNLMNKAYELHAQSSNPEK